MKKRVSCHLWCEAIKSKQDFHYGLPSGGDHFAMGGGHSMKAAAVFVWTHGGVYPWRVLSLQ